MQWKIGSQPSALDYSMHEIIALGVGHLESVVPSREFNPDLNYPVYITEPLVILSLSSLFEQRVWTTWHKWMSSSLYNAPSKSSLGFTFEEVMLLVLMDKFGGKFTALGEVFNFKPLSSLGLREVTLVSLMRRPDGVMSCCDVSWHKGSSDCLGFKANSVADVISFFQNPKGKAFLFPHAQMGPDLIAFFQDNGTKELILLALQCKTTPALDAETWLGAINSVTPDFFYTIMVHFKSLHLIIALNIYFMVIEKWK
jgi:hypothetical protein